MPNKENINSKPVWLTLHEDGTITIRLERFELTQENADGFYNELCEAIKRKEKK